MARPTVRPPHSRGRLMQRVSGIAHYLDPIYERLIIEGLRKLESPHARDYADALENDTYLAETLAPPEEDSSDAR